MELEVEERRWTFYYFTLSSLPSPYQFSHLYFEFKAKNGVLDLFIPSLCWENKPKALGFKLYAHSHFELKKKQGRIVANSEEYLHLYYESNTRAEGSEVRINGDVVEFPDSIVEPANRSTVTHRHPASRPPNLNAI